MHTDENKKYDKRNIESSIKNGVITRKDYDIYLSKLPDAGDKLFNPLELTDDSKDFELKIDNELKSKKKEAKKKGKGK